MIIVKNKEILDKGLGSMLRNDGYRRRGHHEHRELNDIFVPRDRLAFSTRNLLFVNLEILRSVIYKKTSEINRNGTRTDKVWVKKCMREFIEPCKNPIHAYEKKKGDPTTGCSECPEKELPFGQDECGEEFQTKIGRCTECGFMTRSPDIIQKRKINSITRRRMDVNDKTFPQMLFGIGLDIEKHDNGFLVTDYNYTFKDDSKTPTSKSWKQSYRGDPARIRPIISYKSGDLGSLYYTCIRSNEHRKVFERFDMAEIDNFATEWPLCKLSLGDKSLGAENEIICGLPLQKVEYVLLKWENERTAPVYSYIKGEIQHAQKYSPTTAMGVSLIDSLYYPILQLLGQEKWIAEYYLKMRMFKGFLDIPRGTGQKSENLQNMFSAEFQKWNQDPWYVPVFSSPIGSKGIKFVRIDDSPKEMQYGENREETRKQIANAYGISNQFIGDTSAGAGLNNQGLDMAVTNREVKHGQTVMDNQILAPWCASILDIRVEQLEFTVMYNANEEQDQMAEKQRYALDIANHTSLQQMGARVGFDTEGKLYAFAPREGEPLVPGEIPPLPEEEQGALPPRKKEKEGDQGNGKSNDEVDNVNRDGTARDKRTQSVKVEGAPNEPAVQGSNLTAKTSKGLDEDAQILRHLKYSKKKEGPIKDIDMFSNALVSITQLEEPIPTVNLSMELDEVVKHLNKGDPERMFHMIREEDESGVSGTGKVGTGAIFADGTVAFRWDGEKASTNIYNNMDNFEAVHINVHPDNNTKLKFYELKEEPIKKRERRFVEEKHNRDTGGKFSTTEATATAKEPKAKGEEKEGRKASKLASKYRNLSKIPQQQCKNCRYIIRTPNSPLLLCSKVEGFVMAEGWSSFWRSERKSGEE